MVHVTNQPHLVRPRFVALKRKDGADGHGGHGEEREHVHHQIPAQDKRPALPEWGDVDGRTGGGMGGMGGWTEDEEGRRRRSERCLCTRRPSFVAVSSCLRFPTSCACKCDRRGWKGTERDGTCVRVCALGVVVVGRGGEGGRVRMCVCWVW
jgi:hypothetical protein